ncbi:MAG: hypothetical protein JSV36_11585, partial [Anaerolineae bacterium]
GLLAIQNRNYDRVWAQGERLMPPTTYRRGDEEVIFVRFMDFHAATMTFNMARFWRTAGGWDYRLDATELRPIFRDELAAALDVAGFQQVDFYGDYGCSPFEPGMSSDLIAIARR